MKKQAGCSQQARSGNGIILSASDSDIDMGGSDRDLSPVHSSAPSLRAAGRYSTIRQRQGRAGTGRAGQRSHSQGRAHDMDWETEAAELAEEEATLDVSLSLLTLFFVDVLVSLTRRCLYDPIHASARVGPCCLHTLVPDMHAKLEAA